MDVWGVEGVEAEAELLSAVVTFFKSIGITAQDVGIKVMPWDVNDEHTALPPLHPLYPDIDTHTHRSTQGSS